MTSVITVSGSAQVAPSGFGGCAPSFDFSSGVSIMKAIDRPSGDHARWLGVSVKSVMRAACALCIQRTYSCARPVSDKETYARRFPSGDQRGEKCDPDPLTIGVCVRLSTSTSQMDCRERSDMMSYDVRT